jgi:hypothetical protein
MVAIMACMYGNKPMYVCNVCMYVSINNVIIISMYVCMYVIYILCVNICEICMCQMAIIM